MTTLDRALATVMQLSLDQQELLYSCGYDCRIVFSIEKIEHVDPDLEAIVLLDIGTHDRVY